MTSASIPRMPLNDGRTMPQVGFGVFKVTADQADDAVRAALDAGYRHFDLAAYYENEEVIGGALRASGVPREDLFITSKLWNDWHGRERAVQAYEASLERIGVDWLDLYMIHWPAPAQDRYVETWQALADLQAAGRVASIGTSNFRPEHLDRLRVEVGVVPSVNQVELHPYFQQPAQRAHHAAHRIVTEAWSPLGRGAALDDPVLGKLAREHGVSPARLVLRWHLQLGHSVIPKSGHPDRIADNIRLFDFLLTEDDLATIAALDRGERGGPDPLTFT
jgi:2,5-diketo-D-gluconate reductase A